MSRLRGMFSRARDWLVASDPGLQRLRMASTTVLTLAVSLLVLYLLTRATGQPITVVLLGVVISMISSMAVNDPNPSQQRITTLLLPLSAAVAVTLGALLAPYRVPGDVVFVLIMFAATYARRFGPRGMALGMIAFITYFFALFLGASVSQLPWLIGAILIGTAVTFIMRTFVLPDRPEPMLQRTLRAFGARVAVIVQIVRDALDAGALDARHEGRLRTRVSQLNETALMVANQLDQAEAGTLWPGVSEDDLTLRLLDIELAAEWLAVTGRQAVAAATAMPATIRSDLLATLGHVQTALSESSPAAIQHAVGVAGAWRGAQLGQADVNRPATAEAHQLAVALDMLVESLANMHTLANQLAQHAAAVGAVGAPPAQQSAAAEPGAAEPGAEETDEPEHGLASRDEPSPPSAGPRAWIARLRPSTRQAIQIAVATSLAIVAGELLSPSRWYWSVIAAFVIFSGTTSRGQTLTKGWQRLWGTVAGVPAGALIATVIGGDVAFSLVLIFVSLFFGFYLLKVAYSLMIFWITTMLALLYGLLGQFSVGILLVRIEETAAGAVIGIVVAYVVLPTRTRTTIRDDICNFLIGLRDLLDHSTQRLIDAAATPDLIAEARELDQRFQQLRTSAQPLTSGLAGVHGRTSVRQSMRVLTVCDYFARSLARLAGQVPPLTPDAALRASIVYASEQVQQNITALGSVFDGQHPVDMIVTAGVFDAAERMAEGPADGLTSAGPYERSPLLGALRALRAIDHVVTRLACDLGAGERAPALTDPLPGAPVSTGPARLPSQGQSGELAHDEYESQQAERGAS